MLLSPIEHNSGDTVDAFDWHGRDKIRATLSPKVTASLLPLLVVVSAQLENNDYRRIVSSLWSNYLEVEDNAAVAPVSMIYIIIDVVMYLFFF